MTHLQTILNLIIHSSIGLVYENLVLSNELIKVELPPWSIWKDDVSSVSPS